jgi:hypothetical protein
MDREEELLFKIEKLEDRIAPTGTCGSLIGGLLGSATNPCGLVSGVLGTVTNPCHLVSGIVDHTSLSLQINSQGATLHAVVGANISANANINLNLSGMFRGPCGCM